MTSTLRTAVLTGTAALALAGALLSGTAAADTLPLAGTSDCTTAVGNDPDVVKATVDVAADQQKLVAVNAAIKAAGTITAELQATLDEETKEAGLDQTALTQAIAAATATLCATPPVTTTTTAPPATTTTTAPPESTTTAPPATTTTAPATTTTKPATSTVPIDPKHDDGSTATGVAPSDVPNGSVDTGEWP